jgi:hypothetical protein
MLHLHAGAPCCARLSELNRRNGRDPRSASFEPNSLLRDPPPELRGIYGEGLKSIVIFALPCTFEELAAFGAIPDSVPSSPPREATRWDCEMIRLQNPDSRDPIPVPLAVPPFPVSNYLPPTRNARLLYHLLPSCTSIYAILRYIAPSVGTGEPFYRYLSISGRLFLLFWLRFIIPFY